MHILMKKTFSRRLYLILSILLGEEGLQHSVPGMKKDSFTTIISIFKSIKSSQDVVDGNKTKVKMCLTVFSLHLGCCTCSLLLSATQCSYMLFADSVCYM